MQDIVTRYANMFGIFFNYFNEEQKQSIKEGVAQMIKFLKSPPYMRFYSWSLVYYGRTKVCFERIRHWGGMLKRRRNFFLGRIQSNEKRNWTFSDVWTPLWEKSLPRLGFSSQFTFAREILFRRKNQQLRDIRNMKSNQILVVCNGWRKSAKPKRRSFCIFSTKEIKVKASEGEGKLISVQASLKPTRE